MPRKRSPDWEKKPRRFARHFLVGLLIPLGVFSWLHVEGLPGFLRKELFLQLEKRGVFMDAERVRFQIHRGLLLHGVTFFVPQDRVSPTIVAEDVVVNLQLGPLWSERALEGTVRVEHAQLATNLGLWADDLSTEQTLDISRIGMELAFAEGQLHLRRFSGRLLALLLDVQGSWFFPDAGGAFPQSDGAREGTLSQLLARGVQYVEQVELDRPATCRVRFQNNGKTGEDISASIELSYQGRGTLRGLPLDGIEMQAFFHDDQLTVRPCSISAGTNRLDLALDFGVDDKMLQLNLTNSLPRYYLDHLAPPSVFGLLERLDIRVEGNTFFDLQLGPAPLKNVGWHLSGEFEIWDGYYKDAPVPHMSLTLALDPHRLRLFKMKGEAGIGRGRGPLEGEVSYNFLDGAMFLDLKGGFDPAVAGRVLSGTPEAVLRRFEFPGNPPSISIKAEQVRKDGELSFRAGLNCGEVVYHGTKLNHCSAEIVYTNQILSVTNLLAERGEEQLSGHARRDPSGDTVELDLRSSLHPAALARILHPDGGHVLSSFRFYGTNQLVLSGVVDVRDQKRHRLSGTFSGSDVAWRWLGMDALDFSFELQGNSLMIPNIRGREDEGVVAGSLLLKDLDQPETSFFYTQLKGYDLNLFNLVNVGLDTTNNPYSGNLNFSLDLSGGVYEGSEEETSRDSYKGKGSISITEGHLLELPLLGGLSRILNRVVDGVGYVEQTDFSAEFNIRDRRIFSENLFLKGNVVSVKGGGYLGFNQKLKIDLQVKLLSEGILSEALQLITWPITKLIEIRVRGTLSDPEWEPKNLPKELFGK